MGMWDKIKKSAGNLADNVNVMVGEFSAEAAKVKMQTASKGTPEYAALQKQAEIARKNVERSKAVIKHRNAMFEDIKKEEAALNSDKPSMEGDIADGIDEALGMKEPEVQQTQEPMSMESEIAAGIEDALGVSEAELADMEAEMDDFEPVAAERERPQDVQDIVDKMDARIQEREGITLEEKVAQEREALRAAQERAGQRRSERFLRHDGRLFPQARCPGRGAGVDRRPRHECQAHRRRRPRRHLPAGRPRRLAERRSRRGNGEGGADHHRSLCRPPRGARVVLHNIPVGRRRRRRHRRPFARP